MSEPALDVQPVSGSPATPASLAPVVRPSLALVVRRFAWVALLIALDLWSKSAVFAWLEPLREANALVRDVHDHPRFLLAGEWLTFMLQRNPGAAFGQLESFPYLLVGGRILAGVFLVYLIARSAPARRVFNTALVLVLGGALGNLYDNLFLGLPHDGRPFGPVRDFIDVYFAVWNWHFPTFNVADSYITVGAILLLLSGLSGEKRPARAPEGDTAG